MWQQHFGAPYGESTVEGLVEQMKQMSGPPPQRPEGTPHPLMDHRADFRWKERSSVQPPPAALQPRDHEKKAERGMALAFVGGLLAGLLLAKRM